jgi:phage terminase large subunit-like protein
LSNGALLQQLSRYSPDEALALLQAAEEKRRQECFIRYWQPIPGQKRAIDAFTDEIKILGLLGGNRSGKTEAGAAIATAFLLGKEYFRDEPAWEWVKNLPIPEPPNTVWAVGLDSNVLNRVIWDEKFFRGRGHPGFLPTEYVVRKSDRDRVCELSNGSLLVGMSAESGREKFQSASVDLVWIDEEPEEEIFDECYQRTVDCAGKILVTLTPLVDIGSGSRTPWVYDLSRSGQPDTKFVGLSVLDNPYIPPSELEKLREKWSGHAEERARLYGEFIQRSGLVYPLWAPSLHLMKPIPLPEYWKTVVCIDPAPTGPTAALWCKANEKGDLVFFREYKEANRVVSEHARAILVRNQGQPVDLWLIDPKGGSQRNAETHRSVAQLYRDAGIPVRLAEVGEDYGVQALGEFIAANHDKTARHPKVAVFDNLEQFKDEIESYTWAVNKAGENKGLPTGKPRKHNDHLVNCAQYIAAMRPRARGSVSASDVAQRVRTNSYTIPEAQWG